MAPSLLGSEIRTILVYGAGVLGSLYAGKLREAGYDVTMLARGERLAELRQHGVVLIEAGSGAISHTHVRIIEQLAPEDAYDLVMVIVRKNQLASVLPALAANRCTPNVLFMLNNAAGPQPLINALARERVLIGFPGGGGERNEGIVRYHLTGSRFQPTTLGELDGRITPRLKMIAAALESAGLPVALSTNMDAWLKTHVALVSPLANALYAAGGDNYRLANTRDGLVLAVRAIREGLAVLRRLNIPITPAHYRVLEWLPEPLLVRVLQRSLATPRAELVVARHANAARDEMLQLADEFRALARQANLSTPSVEILYSYIDPVNAPSPEGQAGLPLDWHQAVAEFGALISLLALGVYLLSRRKG